MFKTIAKLIGNTERTIFAWKKENRPIVSLIQKYFSEEDLQEFIETGEISKFRSMVSFQDGIEKSFESLFNSIMRITGSHGLYYFFMFLEKHKSELFEIHNNYNSLHEIGRPNQCNVRLISKLDEFYIDEKLYEQADLKQYFSELTVLLFESKYEVRLYLFQSFNTDFKYVKSKEIKAAYGLFKSSKDAQSFIQKIYS